MINILKLREMQKQSEEYKSKKNKERKTPESEKKISKSVPKIKKQKQVKASKKNTGKVVKKVKKTVGEVKQVKEVTDNPVADTQDPEFAGQETNQKKKESGNESVAESTKDFDPAERLRQQLIDELMSKDSPLISAEKDESKDINEEKVEIQIKEEEKLTEPEISDIAGQINIMQQEPVIEESKILIEEKAKEDEAGQEIKNNIEQPKGDNVVSDIETETKGKKNNEREIEEIQLVGFILGNEHYGVSIDKIQEINRMLEITRVPNSPAYIEGVINLRGAVIPVINLRLKIGMEPKKYDSKARIIIVEINEITIGFIVDEVKEVLRINKNLLSPPPDLSVNIRTDYITAIAKLEDELIIIIDSEKLLLEDK
jgi:purine-binding chemotaxis protein CheW